MTEKKKQNIFMNIENRDDALKVANDCGNAFFVVAAIQAAFGVFIAPSLFFDAALYASCGYFIRFKRSRLAAVIVLLLSGIALVSTVLNRMGQNVGGGHNILLAVIVAIAAVRAVEATFKLHGRLRFLPNEAESD